MYTQENSPTLQTIIGNADIHQIIDERLIPWETSYRNTEKYLVEGLPDVVVRHNPGEFSSPQHAEVVASAFNRLPQHDIPTLPYVIANHNEEIYVVTRRLYGQDLLAIATPDASNALHQQIDRHFTRVIDYTRRARQEGFDYADDILEPSQYMLGRTSVDTEDAIRLVDLSTRSLILNADATIVGGYYEAIMFEGARAVLRLEQGLGRHLSMSRLALDEAIDLGDLSAPPYDDTDSINNSYLKALRRAYLNASRYMLKHHVDLHAEGIQLLDEEDDLIERFDTTDGLT
jgi:hypothetical protein